MTVKEVMQSTSSAVWIERLGKRIFDSEESTFKEYKDLKESRVLRIEPDSDGGRKYLTLVIE